MGKTRYHHSSHSVHDIKYHIVWVTKYRYQVLRGAIGHRARDLIREICMSREVTIVRGSVSPDHVHLLVGAPPKLAPAKIVQYVKGRSSRKRQEEFEELRKRYWGSTCGRVATSARRWVRWTRRRSNGTSRSRSGAMTGATGSRWWGHRSLEPAISWATSGGTSRNRTFSPHQTYRL